MDEQTARLFIANRWPVRRWNETDRCWRLRRREAMQTILAVFSDDFSTRSIVRMIVAEELVSERQAFRIIAAAKKAAS